MVTERLSNAWRGLLVRGVLAAALGLIALFWPSSSLSLLLRVVGIFLLADAIAVYVSSRRSPLRGSGSMQTAVSLVAGVALLIFPAVFARLAFVVLGIWAIVTGLAYLIDRRQVDALGDQGSAPAILGIASLVAGAVLVFWPGSGVVALAWAIAAVALILGAILIAVALHLRRIEAGLRERLHR